MDSKETREAFHAGSWYSSNKNELDKQLVSWLENAKIEIKNVKLLKAVIAPHAGYAYSGPTAAWSYKYMKFSPQDPLRVFLLGPCHHVYIRGCGLTSLSNFDTPLGGISIDHETIAQLKKEGTWKETDKETEEEEHSLEMHLPYIKKMFEGRDIKLVPIMVGAIDRKLEEYFGGLLAKYFDDPNTIFIVSSDFCHWGKRFQYTPYDKDQGEIHQSIKSLDEKGMSLIIRHDCTGFSDYLDDTENTICGRHPISILLNIIKQSQFSSQLLTKFVKYAQSEPVKTMNQSSVSYASAITYLEEPGNSHYIL